MMYKWQLAYIKAFKEDFPVSNVAELTEYEICRIMQYCVEHNTKYTKKIVAAIVGQGKVGESKTGLENKEE